MTRTEIEAMVLDIIEAADYDLYKSLIPELAEDPDDAEDFLAQLVDVASAHIKNEPQDRIYEC